jgi:predicted DNA binding CopG/RHH family protein
MIDNYTSEEHEIVEALEHDQITLKNPSKEEIEAIRSSAKESLKKSKRITIRLYKHDYIAIQEKASELGLPYQTLISSVIHRYLDGDLAPRSAG